MNEEVYVDIETYRQFFLVGFLRERDEKRVGVEYSSRQPVYNRDMVRRVLTQNTTYGYNSLAYDLPLIWYSLREDVTNEMLKQASDRIIKSGMRPWDVEDFLGIHIPWEVKNRHVDLMGVQPNAFASLKILNARGHGPRLQDLPFEPEHVPSEADMDVITDYCLNTDLNATRLVRKTLDEPIALRRALSAQYGQNFMSKSDSQIGEAIVKKRVEEMTGRKPERVSTPAGTTFRYPVPDYIEFQSPHLRAILDKIRDTEFIINAEGKVVLPDWLSEAPVKIGDTEYSMGIGGLHSTEKNRAIIANDEFALVDADVQSQYPAIIMSLGLAPKSLGKTFLQVYDAIRVDRLKAKARAKEIKQLMESTPNDSSLAAELAKCTVADKGAKIQLNGVYGKLGSPYSILHAPHLLVSVTLTGQLTILMLAERAEAAGITVVSANTDGLLFRCPRSMFNGLVKDRLRPSALSAVTDWWEQKTGYVLEFGEYSAIYNQSVNSYFAIKSDGGHKRKGPLGNPWCEDKNDFDPVRGQLMKNPQMTICSDAALARIKHGTPVRETIRACTDIRQFVTVIKVTKGATWRGKYLGKTIRYYWSTDGEDIIESQPNPKTGNYKKVPKTDGAAECMTLPATLPSDIDYDRYIAEAEDILKSLGYFGEVRPPEKRIRLTKANWLDVLRMWVTAP